jgi:hypothetical protein
MVNFRLSEQEYERLQNVCAARGARSISDFARAAVARSLGEPTVSDAPSAEWRREIDRKIEELSGEVKRLAQLVRNERGKDSDALH